MPFVFSHVEYCDMHFVYGFCEVLCPVSRPKRTLDCVLLQKSDRALVAKLGLEINSRACQLIINYK